MNEATPDAARGLQAPLQYLKGVGPQRAKLLSRLGLETIEDALFFVPSRHEDRSRLTPFRELAEGIAQSCAGTVARINAPPRGNPRVPLSVTFRDGTGYLTAVWFNQPYLADKFEKASERKQTVFLFGRTARFRNGPLQMQHPDYEVVEEDEDETLHTGRLVPIYRLTEGLPQRWLRSLLWRVLDEHAPRVAESLPEALRRRRRLSALSDAVRAIHFPQTEEEFATARRRLVFDDFFLFELGLAIRRQREGRQRGIAMAPAGELGQRLRQGLAFRLTAAQERVWEEIRRDLAAPHPMSRLLQGDVGSGKTVVAALAVLTAVEAGYQAAVMAPTEILAEQHLLTLRQWLPPLGVPVELLTSAIKGRERYVLLEGVKSGDIPCLVGTHALIQEGVEFRRLGLVVVDEQHRFGVAQRARLREKGDNPHVLVMTATPIPRTLALTLYGDLDVSVINEMPPGRQPVVTVARPEGQRAQIYAFLRQQTTEGRQVYVVCPLVEESEAMDLKAATEMADRLQDEVFTDLKVGLLHGRLSFAEKEAVMRAFKEGQIHVLVSTTVIEVGIDVPNASVMLVEHAERFGLSQLHQLRGRVGRGPWKSYCILLESGGLSDEARRRLEAMTQTNDGFRIAEVDLELRGPGDFFGIRQSGLPEFRVADLLRDGRVLEEARQDAFALVAADPDLQRPEHRALRQALLARWRGKLDLASVG
ncbi:MAG: ATP-dependent DNA helicase RecG [Candidatus Rokubacteria bacterium]|nr:ATP-dependent DNA helicase RecG [Candidatus Rokubacteria bacterium]